MLKCMRRQAYQPQPIRRVYIPKPGKKEKRPWGVPSVTGRALQRGVVQVLSRIYEQDFESSSFGGRPGLSAHHALATLNEVIAGRKVSRVLDADLKNFFQYRCSRARRSRHRAHGSQPHRLHGSRCRRNRHCIPFVGISVVATVTAGFRWMPETFLDIAAVDEPGRGDSSSPRLHVRYSLRSSVGAGLGTAWPCLARTDYARLRTTSYPRCGKLLVPWLADARTGPDPEDFARSTKTPRKEPP